MKTKLMKTLLAVACLLSSICASAFDFVVDGIYYDIESLTDITCTVTKGDIEYNGDITIPTNVTYNNRTFAVTSIGDFAFSYCSELTNVTIPSSVTSIGECAFLSCFGLTSVTIPNSVTNIGNHAFIWCKKLTNVTIPSSVTSIEKGTFSQCYRLTNITIPNSVKSIGVQAFDGCSGLTSMTIPNSVTSIGVNAFNECTNLKSLIIDDGEKKLTLGYNTYDGKYEGLFASCPLEYVYIGMRLDYNSNYGYHPFYKCKESIKEIAFGKCIIKIPDYMKDLSKLEIMTLYNTTPPYVSSSYFTTNQYENVNVYVPKGSLEAYQQADVWKDFQNLQEKDLTGIETVVANGNNTDNVIYDMQGRRLDAPKAGLNIINGKKVMIRK